MQPGCSRVRLEAESATPEGRLEGPVWRIYGRARSEPLLPLLRAVRVVDLRQKGEDLRDRVARVLLLLARRKQLAWGKHTPPRDQRLGALRRRRRQAARVGAGLAAAAREVVAGRLRRGVGGGSSPESDLILALMLSCEVRSDWISARSAASCALASAESKGCGGLVACSQLEAW